MSSEKNSVTAGKTASLAVAGGDAFVCAVEGIFYGVARRSQPSVRHAWGVLPQTQNASICCEYLLKLLDKGCRRFVSFCPSGEASAAWPIEIQRHRFLKPYLTTVTSLADLAILAEDEAGSQPSVGLSRYIEAILLQESVKSFSHGSRDDVVNGFLAPARLLPGAKRIARRDGWVNIWQQFCRYVLKQKNVELQIGHELAAACEPLTRWVEGKSKSLDDSDLERVMMLLTQVRMLADRKSDKQTDSPIPVNVATLGDPNGFRILVTDDHAAIWQSVFVELLDDLCAKLGGNVQIEFSLDGRTLASDKKQRFFFGAYDLVLLDVFLGSSSGTGTDILKSIRRDFSQLPVLLWTTSRDEEITSAARLANGILLKKLVSREALIESLAEWVKRGRAVRTKTLPNPFFHHTIQSQDLRELSVDFHEWCLKQLDSFHALDGEYFRYFTDHGGRHIVKLWELLEKAIEPFLHDDTTLFPLAEDEKSAREREREIAGLYLATICHELGMFPMKIGKNVENFAKLGRDYLSDVRALHAVRGMALLADTEGVYWNDLAGMRLSLRLRKFSGLNERLAVLVGYHARFFKSMDEKSFLNGKVARKTLKNKLGALSSSWPAIGSKDTVFGRVFGDLAKQFPDEAVRKRLRRQCALFRFVDALDVTASRNPADFLIGSNTLRPQQYGENLKRELCESAGIIAGDVYAKMKAPAPEATVVRSVLKFVKKAKFVKAKDGKAALAMIARLDADAQVKSPWGTSVSEPLNPKEASSLQKSLDSWLAKVWEVLVLKDGETAFLQHLKELGVLDGKSHRPRLVFSGAKLLTSLTSLSVAAELLDEYAAIIDAGLTDKIALPRTVDGMAQGFQWSQDWRDVPEELITLLKVLPEDERKARKQETMC